MYVALLSKYLHIINVLCIKFNANDAYMYITYSPIS